MLTSSFRSQRCVTLSVCCYSSQSSCKVVTRRMPKTAASCGGPMVPTSIEPVTANYCLTTLQFNRRLCHRRLIDITYACRRFFASRAALLSALPAEKKIFRAPSNRRDSISLKVIINVSCIERPITARERLAMLIDCQTRQFLQKFLILQMIIGDSLRLVHFITVF